LGDDYHPFRQRKINGYVANAGLYDMISFRHGLSVVTAIGDIRRTTGYLMNAFLKGCGATAVLLTAGAASAIGPSFDCSAVSTPLASLICASPELSRIDLEFVQAYYALRQQVGQPSWQALKLEAIAFQERTMQRCGIPPSGPAPANDSTMITCVRLAYEWQRDNWRSRLTGAAAEEASRPIDEHLALQRDLQALGFLPANEKVDAVYGDATRAAIAAWQTARGLPVTGFLSHPDAARLLADTVTAGTPTLAPSPPTQVLASPSSPITPRRSSPALPADESGTGESDWQKVCSKRCGIRYQTELRTCPAILCCALNYG
jgi:hypothetical protein